MNQPGRDYILHSIVVGPIETNCYIFGSSRGREVVIIDPGADYGKIKHLIDKEALIPKFIINTHGHADHTGANGEFKLPVYIHKADADFLTDPVKNLSAFCLEAVASPKASRMLEDGEEIDAAGIGLRVIHTPGHTPGGISLHYNGVVFTGDALFECSIGRADFPYSDHQQLIDSIKNKLMKLDDGVIVLPGHGSQTSIGEERRNNPWL